MPRLVRRAPLSERIQAYLNPYDFLLWLSEELNGNDWEDFQKAWALPIGAALNLVFVIARSNSGSRHVAGGDDVFGDYEGRRGSGWLAWMCAFIVHTFAILSVSNAFYTITRKRHYRLFEQNIDAVPSTPSAHRVKVDSSPMSSSPLRFLSTIINANSAESRAHPDATRDVWEIAVWDPTPICLRLFCLFSPGHVLVYWLFLPVSVVDPRPSVTVVTTMFLGILLSVQLSILQSSFSQQSKDSAIIHKEVMNEYDTKFVHPSLNRPVRDVGTQTLPALNTPSKKKHSNEMSTTEVDTYTPTTIINRGFKTNPNPAYSSQFYEDNTLQNQIRNRLPRSSTTPAFFTPANAYSFAPTPARGSSPEKPADFSSPIRGPAGASTSAFPRPPDTAFRQTLLHQNSPRKSDIGVSTGDGGSLGVYTHAASPLRKTASSNILRSKEGAAGELRKREGSPLKRTSMPGFANEDPVRSGGGALNQRFRELRGGERRRESGKF